MDVVDIMDTHSEEVAENVETAVMPIAQVTPTITTMVSGVLGGKHLYKKLNEHLNGIDNFFDTEDGKKLNQIIKEIISLKQKENSDISKVGNMFGLKYENGISEFFPQRIFNKKNLQILENSNQSEVKKLIPDLKALKDKFYKFDGISKNLGKQAGFIAGAIGAVYVATYILSNVLSAKLQVNASRVARWQSREDLKDPKYFVQYTPEQIAQAKNNLEQNQNTKNDPSFKGGILNPKGGLFGSKENKENKGFFKTISGIIKDGKKYDEWKQTYNIEDKKIKRNLTKEELNEAQKDKEVIQRITKKINNNAEEYCEDMEVAAGVLIGGTPYLGLGISSLLNLLINKTGLGTKIGQGHLNKALKGIDKETAEQITNLHKTINTATDKKDGIIGILKKGKNNLEFFEKSANSILGNGKKELGKTIGKTYHLLMSTKYLRNTVIGVAGTLITSITGALIGLKLQKASARAGRYKAKQEIANDPRNFIGFSEQDFEEVKEIKGKKKKIGQKIKETITFIPRVIGDYIKYEKYRKTEAKQDKKLLNELIKVDVSKKQLEEAKDLQRKVFTTFENVDDKSQEYSESIEAVTEMSAPVLPYLGIVATITPVIVALIKTFKGGKGNAIEKITGLLAKNTRFLKGKTTHKILNEVAENVSTVTQKTQLPENFKLTKNGLPEEIFKNMPDKSSMKKAANAFVEELENAIKSKKGKEYINELIDSLPESNISSFFKTLIKTEMNEEQLAKIYENIKIIYKNIPTEDLEKIINCIQEELTKNPEKFMYAVQKGNIAQILASKTAIKISSISAAAYTALGLLLTYGFESILAGMQKNAGKLGVMTALEELKDDRYYANEYSSIENKIQEPKETPKNKFNKMQSEMLQKMLAKQKNA